MSTMGLKRHIGRVSLVLMTLNAIIGTGIFFLPALGAQIAGPASLTSWVIMAVAAFFISLYFAELISLYPKSGGVYEYVKHAFGEFYGFLFGWIAWIVANITIAMLVVGSLVYLFPALPAVQKMLVSVALIIAFNYVSYRGISVSTSMLTFFGLLSVVVLIMIIAPGAAAADTARLLPFAAPLPLILLAAYFVSETFFGWETSAYLAEEIKDARRVLPKYLVLSTVIIAALSLGVVFVALTTADAAEFAAQDAPLAYLASRFYSPEFSSLYAILIFIPLIGTAASWIVSSPRLLYAMARDRVLPQRLGRIDERFATPANAIMFQTIVTIGVTLAAFANYFVILSLLVPLVLIMYSAVMLSVTRLRMTKPHLTRGFSAPFATWGPVALVLFNALLLTIWLTHTDAAYVLLGISAALVFAGIPLYFLIKLAYDLPFIAGFYDHVSFAWDRLFGVWYGATESDKVINRLSISDGHKVLDFGCGSGLTTVRAANKTGRAGLVVGVDVSEKQLASAFAKLQKLEMPNVVLVKETELRFPKNTFDALMMVNVLEHLENPQHHVRKLLTYLKKGGRFSFLSFGASLGVPAPEFLKSKEAIHQLFDGTGVTPHISSEKKKMTEYIYVWGRK